MKLKEWKKKGKFKRQDGVKSSCYNNKRSDFRKKNMKLRFRGLNLNRVVYRKKKEMLQQPWENNNKLIKLNNLIWSELKNRNKISWSNRKLEIRDYNIWLGKKKWKIKNMQLSWNKKKNIEKM